MLLAQKTPDSRFPLLWEFPGGKIEPKESVQQALFREIQEELGCELEISANKPINSCFDYDFVKIELIALEATIRRGTPQCREHHQLKWWGVEEITEAEWVPADIVIWNELKRRIAT